MLSVLEDLVDFPGAPDAFAPFAYLSAQIASPDAPERAFGVSIEDWLEQQQQQQQQRLSNHPPTPAPTQAPRAPSLARTPSPRLQQQPQQQQQQSRSPSPLSSPPPSPRRALIRDLFGDSGDSAPSPRPQKNPSARGPESHCECNPPYHKDACPFEPKRPGSPAPAPAPKPTQKRPPTPGPSRGASKRRRTITSDGDNDNDNDDDDDDDGDTADVDKMLDPRQVITIDHRRYRAAAQVGPPVKPTPVRVSLINFLMCV